MGGIRGRAASPRGAGAGDRAKSRRLEGEVGVSGRESRSRELQRGTQRRQIPGEGAGRRAGSKSNGTESQTKIKKGQKAPGEKSRSATEKKAKKRGENEKKEVDESATGTKEEQN